MDGFRVGRVVDLMSTSDVVITATGRADVISAADVELAPSDIVLGNAGHFDTEIRVPEIRAAATEVVCYSQGIERFVMPGGKTVDVLTEGRMMNLAGIGPKGNSIESMDLGFALQARSLERIATEAGSLGRGPQAVPDDINRQLAASMVRHMMAGLVDPGTGVNPLVPPLPLAPTTSGSASLDA